MVQSTFYILLLVISFINAAQNSSLDSIPGSGGWISSLWNFENDPAEVENLDAPIKNNKDSNVAANIDEPIPVDNLLDQLSDEVKVSDDQHKKELAEVSQQLRKALFNNTIRKANVFMKGVRHVVDLGLAGSTQRTRSARKADGLSSLFSRVRNWLCGLFYSKKNAEGRDSLPSPDHFPKSFDLRTASSNCRHLVSLIREQAGLNNCWAVAATSVLSDSLCIATDGKYKQPLSVDDVMRCCKNCLTLVDENGAKTTRTTNVLNFLKTHGTVSGGNYNSREGCIPYSFSPNEHLNHPDAKKLIGECEEKCSNEEYATPYEKDKYYVDDYKEYKLPEDAAKVKEHLMTKGSCIARMSVDANFMRFFHKTGIYTPSVWNKITFAHDIRVIGWGEEGGIEYWLVANSWGKNWGDNGVGKMKKANRRNFGSRTWCVEPKIPEIPNSNIEAKLN